MFHKQHNKDDLSWVLSEDLEAGGGCLPRGAALPVAECHGLAAVGGVKHPGSHLQIYFKTKWSLTVWLINVDVLSEEAPTEKLVTCHTLSHQHTMMVVSYPVLTLIPSPRRLAGTDGSWIPTVNSLTAFVKSCAFLYSAALFSSPQNIKLLGFKTKELSYIFITIKDKFEPILRSTGGWEDDGLVRVWRHNSLK